MNKKRLKQIFRIVLFVGTAISLYFVPWLLVKAWILPLPDTLQAQAEEAVDHGFEGVIFFLDQAGQAPKYAAAGWHDRDAKIPARPDALYKIASISKLFDVVAATKLVGNGRLSLDKTLAEYMPELQGRIENANIITLRHMIQHKSGIPNFTDAPNFWEEPGKSYEESLALILDQPANFAPGEDYEYCNTNYLLLTKIMDNALGYGNYQFIKEEILNPLGLNHTYPSLSEVNLDDVMSGYHVGYPHDLKEDQHGMLSTAEDIGTFLRALNDSSVFGPGERELYVYEFDHGGWVPGYQSFAEYDKELDAVLVAFYNTTDSKLYNWNLSEIINKRVFTIAEKQQNSMTTGKNSKTPTQEELVDGVRIVE